MITLLKLECGFHFNVMKAVTCMCLNLQSTIVDADIYQWFGTYKIEVKNWETKNKTAAKMAT